MGSGNEQDYDDDIEQGNEHGRPTKYKPEYDEQAAKLCKLGATDTDLADFFNVSRSTLSLWKVKHESFSDALKVGKGPADERVKLSLYHRAVGYSHPDEHISNFQGEITITPTTKHYPPDTTACIFWLKNRLPEEFRANVEEKPTDDIASALMQLISQQPN